MLVVISDLHFQDTMNDVIKDEQGKDLVEVERNVLPDAFDQTFHAIWALAEKNNAQELIIVLAGDIFDLNRSQKWFYKDNDYIRPYGEHAPDKWGPIAEKIFDDIINSNKETFCIFEKQKERTLKNNQKISFRYIPGNHDRLINMYAPLRRKVRNLLELGDDDSPFEHEITFEKYGVHIRHGHEYDPYNFAGKIPEKGPFVVDKNDYISTPLGDYMTIDFAARLAYEYRKCYEKNIKTGPDENLHRLIYRKLLEFDDLRPVSAIIPFLEAEIPAKQRRRGWKFLSPIVKRVLYRSLESSFVRDQLGLPKFLLAKIVKYVSLKQLINIVVQHQSTRHQSWHLAQRQAIQREPVLKNPKYRYVVSGHTHNPEVEFLRRRRDGKEMFYFDTGTWRQHIGRCNDNRTFARAKALTYVAFYSPDEDLSDEGKKKEYSFDYWSGFTKKETSKTI